MELRSQDLPFYCTKKVPQSILSLLSRGWYSLPGACSDLDLWNFSNYNGDLYDEQLQWRLCNRFCKFSNYSADYVISFVNLANRMAIM